MFQEVFQVLFKSAAGSVSLSTSSSAQVTWFLTKEKGKKSRSALWPQNFQSRKCKYRCFKWSLLFCLALFWILSIFILFLIFQCVDMWKRSPCNLATPSEVDVSQLMGYCYFHIRSLNLTSSSFILWENFLILKNLPYFKNKIMIFLNQLVIFRRFFNINLYINLIPKEICVEQE